MSEARTDRLEARLGHIEETVVRIEATLAATLPHLATKAELADLRSELVGGTSQLRNDVTSEIGNLRSDVTSEIGNLRSDVTSEIGNLRSDVTSEIGKLRAELADKPSRLYLWAVLAAMVGSQAVMLAAAGLIFSFVVARQPPVSPPQHAALVMTAPG